MKNAAKPWAWDHWLQTCSWRELNIGTKSIGVAELMVTVPPTL